MKSNSIWFEIMFWLLLWFGPGIIGMIIQKPVNKLLQYEFFKKIDKYQKENQRTIFLHMTLFLSSSLYALLSFWVLLGD